MEQQKKKSIMKDRQKVKECDKMFRSYIDCVIYNSNDSPKNRCGFLESSLQTQCFLSKEWFQPTIKTHYKMETKETMDKSNK